MSKARKPAPAAKQSPRSKIERHRKSSPPSIVNRTGGRALMSVSQTSQHIPPYIHDTFFGSEPLAGISTEKHPAGAISLTWLLAERRRNPPNIPCMH